MSQLIIDLDKCFECGHDNPINIEMHHVVPQSLNGTKTIPLCVKCHGLVHDRNFIKHRKLTREGIERAKKLGKYKGRKPGSKLSIEKFLDKHIDVIDKLISGSSVRVVAQECNKSTSTVQKVRNILKGQNKL